VVDALESAAGTRLVSAAGALLGREELSLRSRLGSISTSLSARRLAMMSAGVPGFLRGRLGRRTMWRAQSAGHLASEWSAEPQNRQSERFTRDKGINEADAMS
jgi:hypothetical protein